MNIKSPQDALDLIEKRGIKRIKLATTDIDGILRGKYVSKEKFISTLKTKTAFKCRYKLLFAYILAS